MTDEKPNKMRRGLRTSGWVLGWSLGAFVISAAVFGGYQAFSPRVLPGTFFVMTESWDHGWVSAEGSWELSGGKLAAAANQVSIRCRAEQQVCYEASANAFTDGTPSINVSLDDRPIIEWSTNVIVTKNSDECFTYVMTIERATKSVTAVQTRPENIGKNPNCNFGGTLDADALPKRKEYRLVDGFKQGLESMAEERSRIVAPLNAALLLTWSAFVLFRVWRVWRPKRAPAAA